MLAIGPAGDHVADQAVVDLGDGLAQRLGVAAHQPAGDLEALLLGLLAGLDHPANAGAVDREGLLHEHVAALADGVLQVRRPEAWRGGQDDHARPVEAVDGLLVRIEADELAILGDLDLLAEALQLLDTGLHSGLEHIGHGDQLRRPALGGEGVGRRSGAAPAATDQRDLDGIAAGGMHSGHAHHAQR